MVNVVVNRTGLITGDIPINRCAAVAGHHFLNADAGCRERGALRGVVPGRRLCIHIRGQPRRRICVKCLVQVGICSIQRPALNSHGFDIILIHGRLRLRRGVIIVHHKKIETVRSSSLGIQLGGEVVFVVRKRKRDVVGGAVTVETFKHDQVHELPDVVRISLQVGIVKEQTAVGHEQLGGIVGVDALDERLHSGSRPFIGCSPCVWSGRVHCIKEKTVAIEGIAKISGQNFIQTGLAIRGFCHTFDRRPPRRRAGVDVIASPS